MTDNTISRRAAIDAAIEAVDNWDGNTSIGRQKRIEKYINAIPPAQRWILCNVALPKKNGQYIITVKYEHVDGYDDIYAEYGYWTGGRWDAEFGYYHCGMVEKVLAWMPLPTPYQEGDDKHEG